MHKLFSFNFFWVLTVGVYLQGVLIVSTKCLLRKFVWNSENLSFIALGRILSFLTPTHCYILEKKKLNNFLFETLVRFPNKTSHFHSSVFNSAFDFVDVTREHEVLVRRSKNNAIELQYAFNRFLGDLKKNPSNLNQNIDLFKTRYTTQLRLVHFILIFGDYVIFPMLNLSSFKLGYNDLLSCRFDNKVILSAFFNAHKKFIHCCSPSRHLLTKF